MVKRKLLIGVLVVVGIYVFSLIYIVVMALTLKPALAKTSQAVKAVTVNLQEKDLGAAQTNLAQAETELQTISRRYNLIAWLKFIPGLGIYVSDGRHGLNAALTGVAAGKTVLDSIAPYADVLGFSGQETELNIDSAEEKIIFILETLDKISPELEGVSSQLTQAQAEFNQINPSHYPKTLFGKPLREKIVELQNSLKSSEEVLKNIKPLLSLLPKLLGQNEAQTYLLVFQNDAEIRGSGGFLTAYAILETFRGKITPVLSQDIYELDNRFGDRLPAPEPIKKYLPLVYNWHLRDMNLSPDFTVAMDTFLPNYKEVAKYKDFDGVIAMDTQIVVNLLKVLGPVGVADWGTYDAEIVKECNCPQVVYKMEDYATRPTYYIKDNRKGMIGPLMHSILLNVMNSPKKLWPQFMEIGLNDIKAKHLLFYFPDDPEMQAVADAFSASGRIKEYDADYFHLNDTNFAGAKSNLYVTQDIDQVIDVSTDGTITKTVTITYTNPEPPDDCNLESGGLCLNGLLRDWVRLYVPEGSQLVEVLGSDIEPTINKDLGKTVLEAFIELRPESRTKVIFKYTLPFKKSGAYRLLLQKQPGAKNHHYSITLGNNTQEFDLDADRELTF
ncbi:DUF4012 domain-containing protein [Patescibacteria group bacterium]|nr:DUF4012 domain-containing protein [Patescibacteria group bacterium]